MIASDLPPYEDLKRRLLEALAEDRKEPLRQIVRALQRMGPIARRETDPVEMAPYVMRLVEQCVHEHLDMVRLTRDVAALFRESEPLSRRGVDTLEGYEPSARYLVREYVRPAPPPPLPSFLLQF